MGVRGLATFVSERASEHLESLRLQNCVLVVDGNSLAAQLYVRSSKSNAAYGGDYDRYGRCVRQFFKKLSAARIRPLVAFDGGYERRKLPTVWKRLRARIAAAEAVRPHNQTRKNVFPLLMRDTFKQVLMELGVAVAQCDFEADEQLAALARRLGCPLLSLDSDFFVLDVAYIPFDRLHIYPGDKNDADFVSCQVFKMQRFLNALGGLKRSLLPLLATLLGNDYVGRRFFAPFFAQIRLPGSRRHSPQQRRIAGLIRWLRSETLESAVPKILSHVKVADRERVRSAIERAISMYSVGPSQLGDYFDLNGIDLPPEENDEVETESVDVDKEESDSGAEEPQEDEEEEAEEGGIEVEDEAEDDSSSPRVPENVPEWFLNAFRRAQMSPAFMDLFTFSIFIIQPQVEDYSERESACAASLGIVRLAVTLLLGAERAQDVRLVNRRFRSPLTSPLFGDDETPPRTDLPTLAELPSLSLATRRQMLLDAAGAPLCTDPLPSEWRIFVLGAAAWACRPGAAFGALPAVLLSFILQAVVAPTRQGDHSIAPRLADTAGPGPLAHALRQVNASDCRKCFGVVVSPNAHARATGKRDTFDVGIVHGLAQLQGLVLALHQLNQLLLQPFQSPPMHKFYSGTLMYNVSVSLQGRADPEAYVRSSLSSYPSVLAVYEQLASLVKPAVPTLLRPVSSRSKRTRQARPARTTSPLEEVVPDIELVNSDSDNEVDWQSNNKFALLCANR